MSTRGFSQCAALLLLALLSVVPLRAAASPHYVAQFVTKESASSPSGTLARRWKSQTSGNVFEIVLRDGVLIVDRVAGDEGKRSSSELKIHIELRKLGALYVGKNLINRPDVSSTGATSTCPIEITSTISTLTSDRIEGSFVSRSLDANCPSAVADPPPFVWIPTSDTAVSQLAVRKPAPTRLSKEVTDLLSMFDKAVAEKTYDVAAKAMQQAIAIVSNQFGPNHEYVGRLEGDLGLAYEGMGNLEEAINTYRRSTEILARVPSAEETLWRVRVNLSIALSKAGKQDEVIALYKMLLKHWQESRGELYIMTFTTRAMLTSAYLVNGQLGRAIAQGKILVERAKTMYGQDSEQLLVAEGLLAAAYMQTSNLALTIESSESVYRRSERVRGEHHPETLKLGYGYALALQLAGRDDPASAIAEKVYRARVSSNAPLQDVLEAQDFYGRSLGYIGKFEEGEKLLLDGLQVAKGADIEGQDIAFKFMSSLCELRTAWGHKAITVCRESLTFAETAMGRDSLRASTERQQLAEALTYVGENEASALLLETDLKITIPKFGEKHFIVLWAMDGLASTYADLGRTEEAKPLAEKAYNGLLETRGPESVYTQEAKISLASIYINLDLDSQALVLLEQVIDAVEPGGPTSIAAKRELARVYDLMGRNQEAEKMILAALKDAETLYGPTPNKTTTSVLGVLASTHRSSGNSSEALPIIEGIYRRTLDRLGPLHRETLLTQQQYAYCLLSTKDFARGISALLKSLVAIDSWRQVTSVFNKGRAEQWATYSLHFRLAATFGASQDSREAKDLSFRIADRAKTGTLYERLSIKKVLNKPGAQSKEFARLSDTERNIERIDSQIAHVVDDEKRFDLSLERRNLVSAHESALRTLAKTFPALLQARTGSVVDVGQIAESLSRHAAFISFVLTPKGGHAYVITKDAGLTIRRIAGAPSLSQTISAARQAARAHPLMKGVTFDRLWRLQDGSYRYGGKPSEGGEEVKDAEELFSYLGELLFEPIAGIIKGKKNLIVSPDELIALLPLEMLKVDGRYLIEHFDMSYVQSGAMYLLMIKQEREREQSGTRQPTLLAVGGAEYGSKSNVANVQAATGSNKRQARGISGLGLQWEPLPGSRAEVEGVGALFGDQDKVILLGRAASEEGLRKLSSTGELKRYQYLLFSAHGYLSDGDPQLSAVVLTPTGTTNDSDGYLTAVELAEYRLDARLLVLSACDTGVGKYVRGEGVQGLPIGAFLAGAESTLMSLWAVVDETTARFMKTVFRKLLAGKTETQAVSETKREFIANTGGLAKPLFWAPFVLYGI